MYSLIHISGDDAASFLQGQLTCDVLTLAEGTAILGAHCNHKGRMLANFWIFKVADVFFIWLPTAIANHTLAHLNKYAVFSKVTLKITDAYHAIGVMHAEDHAFAKDAVAIGQLPLDSKRQLLFCPIDIVDKQQTLMSDAWQMQDIAEGIVYLTPELSEKLTPQMIGLDQLGGVDFDKGCYVGQEIIARTQHLGKLKRHLYRLSCDSDHIHIGDELLNDKKTSIGVVVNTYQENHQTQLLAVIQDQAISNSISIGEKSLTLHVSNSKHLQ